jgi:hypothetical protein
MHHYRDFATLRDSGRGTADEGKPMHMDDLWTGPLHDASGLPKYARDLGMLTRDSVDSFVV